MHVKTMIVSRPSMMMLLCLALSGGRGSEVYAGPTSRDDGAVRGEVRLTGDIPKAVRLVVSKDANYCGVNKSSPRLRVSASKGVQDAIVWLEGITGGKQTPLENKQLVLNQYKCEYSPHILIVPFGSSLDIVNSDPILHNVHAYDNRDGTRTLFNIAQPIKGQRTAVRQTLFQKAGLYLATCDAGHPWMNAYIMVADNPYYALTDREGHYVLDQVPPGTYRLKMWHEGVAVVKTEMENGKPKTYRYEEPYEEEKEVTVSRGGTTQADFALILRPDASRSPIR